MLATSPRPASALASLPHAPVGSVIAFSVRRLREPPAGVLASASSLATSSDGTLGIDTEQSAALVAPLVLVVVPSAAASDHS
jgi:hypothetical protein